jgi:chromosome segregation ATPase
MYQSNLSVLKEELSVENFKKQQLIEKHTQYEEEISKLRDLMETNVDEEAKQKELRNSREQELESLKLQQSVYQQEIQQLRLKNKDVTTELFEEKQQLREEIYNLEQQRSESEKMKKALKLQVEEVNEKFDITEAFKVRVTDELKIKKSEVSDLQLIVSMSNEKTSLLERKLTAELAKSNELEEQNRNFLSSSDALKKLNTEQESEIIHLTKELAEMNFTNEAIREDNNDLQTKITASEAVRSKVEKEISVVNSEIDRLRAQHRQEVETLRKSLQENVKINQEDRNTFQSEKEKLQSRISQIEKANCRLTTEVEVLRLESDSERSALKQAQTLLKHTETQNETLKAQLSKEQQKGEETDSLARQLQHTVDSLIAEVEEKHDLVTNLQKRKDIVEQELATIGLEANKDDKASNASKKLRRQLEHRVKELEEEELKLKESVRLAEESRKNIEQYGIDYRLQMEHEFSSKETAWRDTKLLLMKEIDKLTETYDTELQKSEKLKDANNQLRQEVHAMEDGSKGNQNGEMTKRLKQIEAEIVKWKHKAETEEMARANYQQVASIYESKAKTLQSEIDQQELKCEEVSAALRNAQKKIDVLEQHRLSDQEAMELMEAKNARLNEQVVQLQEDIERINDQQHADLVSRDLISDGSVRREIWEELNAKNSKLEESKRALQAQLRQLQQSTEDYRRDIGLMEKQHQELQMDMDDIREQLETTSGTLADEMATRRKVDTELHNIQIKFSTETAKAIESAEISIIYKEKAKAAMAKCEDAEMARLRLEKSESILKNQQQELTQNLEKERLHRNEADSRLEVLEVQLREMESSIDEVTIEKESLSNALRRLQEELKMDRERYAKEKEEWTQAEDSSRRKYQRELKNTAGELEEQMETIKRLQYENREQLCAVEELTSRLHEEAAGNVMWRRDKERLEGRISELLETLQLTQDERDDTKDDLEAITIKNSDAQNALLESEIQRAELEQRCRLLQQRIIEEEDQIQIEKKNRQAFERTIQSLSVEIEELKTRMDERHDAQIEAKNKAQKAELLIIEAQNENSRLLKLTDELNQQKVRYIERL